MPARIGAIALVLLVLGHVPGAAAQGKPPEPPPEIDPYTKGVPERLEQAGYRSFGPFLFGKEPSDTVRARLGGLPILWVETAHFRLGSTLAEYLPQPEETEQLRGELARLRERVPGVPAKARRLDPWLRLHLYAQRLEELHAAVAQRLGLTLAPGGAGAKGPGPSLGLGQKFSVFLSQKESTLARFTREYVGSEQPGSCFHHFREQDTLFFGISEESLKLFDSDLHFAVAHGVTQLLVLSLDGFARLPPDWWLQGLALWFARERQPRSLIYARPGGEVQPGERLTDWEPIVRGRVEYSATVGWADMLARPSWREQAFGDNVVLWSRIDFLLREDLARGLVPLLHGPPGPLSDSATALARVSGGDLEALERRWCAWVRAHYRAK